MKNVVFCDVTPCGSDCNHVSEEVSASFIRVTRIGELGTTLAVTRNRRTLRRTCLIEDSDQQCAFVYKEMKLPVL
jgi:hypothetical protein